MPHWPRSPSTRSLRRATTVSRARHGGDDVVGLARRRAVACRAPRCRTGTSRAGEARRDQHARGGNEITSRSAAAGTAPAVASRTGEARRRCALLMPRYDLPNGIEIGGLHHELEGKAQPDREHEQAEQQAQPLAADVLSGARAELGADHAADHQDEREHRVDQVVGGRVHHGGEAMVTRVSTIEVPITTPVGTRRRVDQHRHQQEAAADAHDGADEADDEADPPDRDRRDVDLRALEPDLERQPVNPGVAPPRAISAACRLRAHDRPHAFDDHQGADDAEQQQVGDPDGEVELVQRAQQGEQPDPAAVPNMPPASSISARADRPHVAANR